MNELSEKSRQNLAKFKTCMDHEAWNLNSVQRSGGISQEASRRPGTSSTLLERLTANISESQDHLALDPCISIVRALFFGASRRSRLPTTNLYVNHDSAILAITVLVFQGLTCLDFQVLKPELGSRT